MKRELLHTPEGVRDIYNEECEKKLVLEKNMMSKEIFDLYSWDKSAKQLLNIIKQYQ